VITQSGSGVATSHTAIPDYVGRANARPPPSGLRIKSQQLAGIAAGDGGDRGLIECVHRGDVADRIMLAR